MSEQKDCHVKGSCEKTSVSHFSYVFKWAIENFSKWPTDYDFESKKFKLFDDNYAYINLKKSVKKFRIRGFPNLCLLSLVYLGCDDVKVVLEISISDSAGNIFQTKSNKLCSYDRYNSRSSIEFSSIELDEFTNETQDKILILNFDLKYFTISTEVFVEHAMPSLSDNLPTVVKNFKAMYDNSLFTDVDLIVEDDIVRAHKSVLSASSPVFAKMLSSPMDENSKDSIKITDIEFAILKPFVEFLYTGSLSSDTDFDSVCGLYYAADKYDVPSLRMTCSKIMLAKLDAENTCRVLSLAHLHSDAQLKNSVLEFMKFEFDAVVKTDAWIEFAKSEAALAAEVSQ